MTSGFEPRCGCSRGVDDDVGHTGSVGPRRARLVQAARPRGGAGRARPRRADRAVRVDPRRPPSRGPAGRRRRGAGGAAAGAAAAVGPGRARRRRGAGAAAGRGARPRRRRRARRPPAAPRRRGSARRDAPPAAAAAPPAARARGRIATTAPTRSCSAPSRGTAATDYRAAHRDVAAPPRSPEALRREPVAAAGDRQRRRPGQGGRAAGPRPRRRDVRCAGPATIRCSPPRASSPAAAGAPRATRECGLRRRRGGRRRRPASRPGRRRPRGRRGVEPAPPRPVRSRAALGGRHRPRCPRAGRTGRRARRRPPPGTGATRAEAPVGAGGLAPVAAPTDPYFRAFLRRLSGLVEYPKSLALDMRSGRVIATFRLAADGGVGDIRLLAPSAYEGFDQALVAALRTHRPARSGARPPPRRAPLADRQGPVHVREPGDPIGAVLPCRPGPALLYWRGRLCARRPCSAAGPGAASTSPRRVVSRSWSTPRCCSSWSRPSPRASWAWRASADNAPEAAVGPPAPPMEPSCAADALLAAGAGAGLVRVAARRRHLPVRGRRRAPHRPRALPRQGGPQPVAVALLDPAQIAEAQVDRSRAPARDRHARRSRSSSSRSRRPSWPSSSRRSRSRSSGRPEAHPGGRDRQAGGRGRARSRPLRLRVQHQDRSRDRRPRLASRRTWSRRPSPRS